ncbi:MAG TPA: flagellar basal body-associated protein FliL [Burkholderiaceae bacterium]|nr:flagellar basal body-associated protein FliL [Burkholderiaceae bacterium]
MKANPKLKADTKAEAAPAGGGGKKKLIIIIVAAVLALGGIGGGAAWFFLHGKADEEAPAKPKHKQAKSGPPVFVPIEPFTVNLQPEDSGDQYLQLAFTLQVSGLEEVELIKNNMPKVRSRILLLLSGKHASEINTPEGKKQLSAEIIAQVKEPFEDHGAPQDVTDVLFTSFIIQ